MRIATLGNSHVGMLKAASERPEFDGISFTWMVRQSDRSQNIQITGSEIVDTTTGQAQYMGPGLAQTIDVSDFDAMILVGNTVLIRDVALLCRSHYVPAWFEPRRVKALIASGDSERRVLHPMTEMAFKAAICSAIQNDFTHAWATKLQHATNAPLFVVPPPYANAVALHPPAERFPALKQMDALAVSDQLAAAFDEAHGDAFAAFGNAYVVAQDRSSVTKGFFTAEAFARGAVRVDPTKPFRDNDVVHGNPDLGALILRKIVGKFRSSDGGSGANPP